MIHKTVTLKPQSISVELLEKLERQGLIMLFRPTEKTLMAAEGENVAEELYISDEKFGPHKLISVGVNKTMIRLGMHPDHEEFLLPCHGKNVKPMFLIVCHLGEEEIRKKDQLGALTEEDFTCISCYPAPRGAEMFTMLKNTVHCEATIPGEGEVGCFFVTEPRDLTVEWIDLEKSELEIAVQGSKQ